MGEQQAVLMLPEKFKVFKHHYLFLLCRFLLISGSQNGCWSSRLTWPRFSCNWPSWSHLQLSSYFCPLQLNFASNEVVENDVQHIPLRLKHLMLVGQMVVCALGVCGCVCMRERERQRSRSGQCSWATCPEPCNKGLGRKLILSRKQTVATDNQNILSSYFLSSSPRPSTRAATHLLRSSRVHHQLALASTNGLSCK